MKNWKRVTSASFLTALMAIGNVVPSMAATTDNSISQREKDNAALAREGLYVVRWMRSAARLQSQSVLRMYTLSGKARLGSGTI